MDTSNTLALPQLILVMSLLTLLISWLVIFAYLAIRPIPEKQVDTSPLPAIKSPVVQTLPVVPRASSIPTVTEQTPIITIAPTNSRREIVLDHSSC